MQLKITENLNVPFKEEDVSQHKIKDSELISNVIQKTSADDYAYLYKSVYTVIFFILVVLATSVVLTIFLLKKYGQYHKYSKLLYIPIILMVAIIMVTFINLIDKYIKNRKLLIEYSPEEEESTESISDLLDRSYKYLKYINLEYEYSAKSSIDIINANHTSIKSLLCSMLKSYSFNNNISTEATNTHKKLLGYILALYVIHNIRSIYIFNRPNLINKNDIKNSINKAVNIASVIDHQTRCVKSSLSSESNLALLNYISAKDIFSSTGAFNDFCKEDDSLSDTLLKMMNELLIKPEQQQTNRIFALRHIQKFSFYLSIPGDIKDKDLSYRILTRIVTEIIDEPDIKLLRDLKLVSVSLINDIASTILKLKDLLLDS